MEHLRRPEGRRLPPRGNSRPGTAGRALGDRPGLNGGVLRVRARPGLVADEALRASRRAHPGLLTRHLAGRRLPVEQRRERTAGRRVPPRRRGLRYPGGPRGGVHGHRPAGNHPGRRALRS